MATLKRKILVHVCCAACASHVFAGLQKSGFEPIAFFYHPEISDEDEFSKRLSDVEKFCTTNDIKLIKKDFLSTEFDDLILPYKDQKSLKYIKESDRYQRRRCQLCNSLIVQKTVEETKKLHLKYFTLTLLCSPYKDHDQVVDIANEKALDYNLNFYYNDFRKGYWMGRNYARNHNIAIPNYCGCAESKTERRLE